VSWTYPDNDRVTAPVTTAAAGGAAPIRWGAGSPAGDRARPPGGRRSDRADPRRSTPPGRAPER
jgi:hypothetical protein